MKTNNILSIHIQVRHLPTTVLKTLRSDWETVTLQFDYLSKQIQSTLHYQAQQSQKSHSKSKGGHLIKGQNSKQKTLNNSNINEAFNDDEDENAYLINNNNTDDNGNSLVKIDKKIFMKQKPSSATATATKSKQVSSNNNSNNNTADLPENEILKTKLSSNDPTGIRRRKMNMNNNNNNNNNEPEEMAVVASEDGNGEDSRRMKPNQNTLNPDKNGQPVSFWLQPAQWLSLWSSSSNNTTNNKQNKYKVVPFDKAIPIYTKSNLLLCDEELGDKNNELIAAVNSNQPIAVYNVQIPSDNHHILSSTYKTPYKDNNKLATYDKLETGKAKNKNTSSKSQHSKDEFDPEYEVSHY